MPALPAKIILLIAIYAEPPDQESLLQAFPGIAGLFTFHHFASTDNNGNTVLHLQAQARTTSKANRHTRKVLCFPSILASSQGSCLHPQNDDGVTPLMYAAKAHNLKFMRLLLAKDPDGVNMIDNEGTTALWYAVFSAHVKGLGLLLSQPTINVNHPKHIKDRYGYEYDATPIIYALDSGFGNYETVSLLLKHPAIDLTWVDENGHNPLMLAIWGDREDLVPDILTHRDAFDINATRSDGGTALHLAAYQYSPEIIEMLLAEDGIEPDLPDSKGQTPLLWATYDLAIEALLTHSRGAVAVNHVDRLGRSALSYAAERDNEMCARMLLKYGAKPDLKDSSGYTPISRAAMAMHGDMVELLGTAMGIT
ncbi:ankyrin repeat-containing domain protein [Aspergillus pseudoustus]|uniref:Ankyrin repeat-containing domain protein n=1 Tax=Aspergillus pseudoustus TaxID=1810923 RepID=A0ABR4IUB3_9EURO